MGKYVWGVWTCKHNIICMLVYHKHLYAYDKCLYVTIKIHDMKISSAYIRFLFNVLST